MLPRRLAGAEHEKTVDYTEWLRPLRRFKLRKVNTSFHAHNFTDGGLTFGGVEVEEGVEWRERGASPQCLASLALPCPRCLPPPAALHLAANKGSYTRSFRSLTTLFQHSHH